MESSKKKKIDPLRLFLAGRIDIVLVYFFVILSFLNFYGTPKDRPSWFVLVSLVLLVAASYLYNKLYDYEGDTLTQSRGALKKNNLVLILVVFLAGLPGAIAVLANQPIEPYITPYFIGILLGFFYSFPIKGKRIKNFFLLKNLFAAFAWFISIVFLLSLYLDVGNFTEIMFDQIYLFFLFLIYEIIWDIKDIEADKKMKVSTIPVRHGLAMTKISVAVLIFIVFLLVNFDITRIGFISVLYLLAWLIFLTEKTPIMYYHLLILGQIGIIITHILLR